MGFLYPYRLGRNRNGSGVTIYIWEDISSKLLSNHNFEEDTEGLFAEINFIRFLKTIFAYFKSPCTSEEKTVKSSSYTLRHKNFTKGNIRRSNLQTKYLTPKSLKKFRKQKNYAKKRNKKNAKKKKNRKEKKGKNWKITQNILQQPKGIKHYWRKNILEKYSTHFFWK